MFQFEIQEFEKKNWQENLHLKIDLHGFATRQMDLQT